MKRAKILLASLFAFLMVVVCLTQPAYAPLSNPDLVIDPDGIDVNVSSTFTIDIWIKNIPSGLVMTAFEFQVVWDPAMMELVSHDFLADDKGWQIDKDAVKEGEGQYQCLTHAISAGSWDIDAKWLTLEFHSLAEGSTTIHALDLYTGTGTVWLSDGVTTQTVPFDSDEITVNQHQPGPPAGPSGYVGGEVFSANKLAVLSPYLALISIVAVAAVLVKRRKP